MNFNIILILLLILIPSEGTALMLMYLRPALWRRKHCYLADGMITNVKTAYTTPKYICYQITVDYTDQNGLHQQTELLTCNPQTVQSSIVSLSVVDTGNNPEKLDVSISDLLFHPETLVKEAEFADKKANAKPFVIL